MLVVVIAEKISAIIICFIVISLIVNFLKHKISCFIVIRSNIILDSFTNIMVFTFDFVCGSQKSAEHSKKFSKIMGTNGY